MIYIYNPSTDPYYNLALEEFLVSAKDKELATSDIFMLWQNRPTVVVGKHQNSVHEINREYLKREGINLVRRLSGGGAVYHDEGNLNFTFIKRNSKEFHNDFSFFTQPLVEALREIGVQAEFVGRNDIEIDGAKFSGNAQYALGSTVMHHGTILWDSDLSVLSEVLKPKKQRGAELVKKVPGVASKPRTVTNVSAHSDMKLEEFIKRFARHVVGAKEGEELKSFELSLVQLEKVAELADTKYRTQSWNWGKSPLYTHRFEKRFDAGNVMLALRVKEDLIEAFDIYGDFFVRDSFEEFADIFKGTRFSEFEKTALNLRAEDYIHNLSSQELVLLVQASNRL